MSILSIKSIKDEHYSCNNSEEQKLDDDNKTVSNFNLKKIKSKYSLDLNLLKVNNNKKLDQSFSKLNLKKKNLIGNKQEGNMINDYLHSHKFGIQRKKTRRVTVMPHERKNSINNPMNKSIRYSKKDFENLSMIYYPNGKNPKNIMEEIKNIENINLKMVENSIILKINSMRMNFQNETNNDNDKFDNYFENVVNTSNMNSNRSKKDSFRSSYIKRKNKSNANLHSFFKINNGLISSDIKNSNINNSSHNHQSSNIINSNKKHPSNFIKYKSDILNNSFDKFPFEKIENDLKLSDVGSKKNLKKKKLSKRISVNNCDLKEKERNRILNRIKPLYDSFDDDESDKDEEENVVGVFAPNSIIIFFFDFFLFITSVYCLFYIPLKMAKDECFCSEENKFNKVIMYFAEILYILDFCISFFRGYYNYQLKIILNSSKIFMHYLKTDCVFDFLEAIPIFTFNRFLCIKNKEVNYCFRYNMANSLIYLKMFKNIKIFKIFKVRNKQKNVTFNYFFDLFSENYFLEKLIDNLMDFFFCFLAFHFFVCLNIFLSKNTYPNWIVVNNVYDKSFYYKYIASSYSLIETLTTVGYGDLVCQSNLERIFQIFFLGVGVIAYSYLISSFGNLFKNESQSSIKYNNNMKILEEIRVDYPNMPYKLYNKIYNYIESRNMAEKKSDSNILTNSLPFNLKNALLLIMYQNDIKNFKFFKNCDNSNFIIQVLSAFVPATSKKLEILVYEGEMIEDIIIVKDGRLSLEAAIDLDDPENSIQNYFNINFQGITTAKEIKKLKESKESTSRIIQAKRTKDFDNAKNVLNNVVKKQANFLFNEVCDDISLLDKTKNENKKENQKLYHNATDFLKNEPIKNEKGNFKYIKILDIRKNENFGGLYMFLRRPSPLSLKVRSKFAELYLLPKKEVFVIAKNYGNIWSKIHKKDFHNMVSIKHQTFNILHKFIEINGIGKIAPNDVSRFIYSWEANGARKKNSRDLFESRDDKDISKDHKTNFFKNRHSSQFCSSPITIKTNLSPHNNIFYNRYNNFNNLNFSNKKILPNQSIDNASPQNNNNQQRIPTEMDFSQLLTLMANEKQKKLNNNIIGKDNNTNNNKTNDNTNNIQNNNVNKSIEGKESAGSFGSNFFNNKQKTQKSNEDGKTLILPNGSEKSLPNLSHIFDEKKAEEIKKEMIKSKKKENRKKIFSFGKKTAEIFRNNNYSIFLVGKGLNNIIEIKNSNDQSFKSLIKDKDMDIDGLGNYISFCRDKLFLNKISDISSSEEYSIYQFDKKDLSQEGVTSFTIESIYQNINIYSNMKYSQNKLYQQKTLNYLTRLIENNGESFSSESQYSSSSSSQLSNSSSFSKYFSHNNENIRNSSVISSKIQKSQSNKFISNSLSSHKFGKLNDENSIFKSDNSKNSKNSKKINNNDNNQKRNSIKKFGDNRLKLFPDSNIKNKRLSFNSLKPKQINNLDTFNVKVYKSPRKSHISRRDDKITFKIESSNNEGSSCNNNATNILTRKNKNSLIDKKNSKFKQTKNSLFLFRETNMNNIKVVKNSKTSKRGINTDKKKNEISKNKTNAKGSLSKEKIDKKRTKNTLTINNKKTNQYHRFKSDKKILNDKSEQSEKNNNEIIIKNSMAYFSKEQKEDCLII